MILLRCWDRSLPPLRSPVSSNLLVSICLKGNRSTRPHPAATWPPHLTRLLLPLLPYPPPPLLHADPLPALHPPPALVLLGLGQLHILLESVRKLERARLEPSMPVVQLFRGSRQQEVQSASKLLLGPMSSLRLSPVVLLHPLVPT